VLTGCRRDTIFLNGHAETEVKVDGSKDSFCEEFEQAFDHLTKYHVKIFLGDFNKELVREYIFKPINGNGSSKYSNNNAVRVVYFATPNTMVVKSMVFPHRNFINTPGPILMGRIQWRLVELS
jgi:hypothetical protein